MDGTPEWEYDEGATIGLALFDLEDEGLVEFSRRHEVRLTRKGTDG